jgi:enoyl-CoA hydratase/carnithine racemase
VAPDELIPAARALAKTYVDGTAPVSIALMRRMMWQMLGASHPMDAHRIDSKAMYHRGRSADVREGIASFLEKRPPLFTDTVSGEFPELPWGEKPEYR